MRSQRSFRKTCLSCLNRRKLANAPDVSLVSLNLAKYAVPYGIAIGSVMMMAGWLGSWNVFLPLLSLCLFAVYFQYVRAEKPSRARWLAMLFPHVFFVGFFGGTGMIVAIVLVSVGCLAHATLRKPSKVDAMHRVAQSEDPTAALEMGVRSIAVDPISTGSEELERFRAHSASLKKKYGLE